MSTDREKLEQKIRNTPKQVFLCLYLSVILGVLIGLRAILMRMAAGAFSGKALLFAGITIGFFTFNGMGLLTKNRLAYVLIAVFALLPAPGSLAGAVHLLALLMTGKIAANLSETMASVVALLQFGVILALFINLFSRTTRSYVWSKTADSGPTK